MEKADILINRCLILPMNGQNPIEDGTLAVKDGKLIFVGKAASATHIKADVKMDARGKVAMPGLINCHTHVPMTLFRGIAEDQPLDKWLKETIWPLEAKLKPEDVYAGALLGCLEMIKGGVTCFADMYFHEDMVARAVEESHIRAVLAEGIIESGNKTMGQRMFKTSVDFARRFNGRSHGRIKTMLGPHAAYTCSPELLSKVTDEASELNVGIHTHIAESGALFKEVEEKQGLSEVEYLEKIGFLNSNVVAAHCIDLSRSDMKILSERGVNVAHAPVANMKLGLGAAKIHDLLGLGINVGLGTDGPASNNTIDMFETIKTAALLQKLTYHDPSVLPAYEVLKMATVNGAKALGLEKQAGSLETGMKADVILVSLWKPHLRPLHNVCASLVYSTHASDVETVIVDGQVLMENKHVRVLDEQAVMERAERAASSLLSR